MAPSGAIRYKSRSRPAGRLGGLRLGDLVTEARDADAAGFTARLTIDVTPELRGRIKIAAFRRGQTVADMLRDLLAREFPADEGDPS